MQGLGIWLHSPKSPFPEKDSWLFEDEQWRKAKHKSTLRLPEYFYNINTYVFFSSNPVFKSKIVFASSRYPTYTSDFNCYVIDDEYTILLIGIALSCHSVTHSVMFFRLGWCDSGVWRFTQPLLALPAVVSFDSHVVDVGTKQNSRCWCQIKSHVVDARWKQSPCCWRQNKTKPMLLLVDENKPCCRCCFFDTTYFL